jgi:hypothetical protein
VALALCSIIFPPGTHTVFGSTVDAAYWITRDGQLVARGAAKIHRGQVTLLRLRPLARGRYRLTLTTGRGGNQHTLLDRIVRIQ